MKSSQFKTLLESLVKEVMSQLDASTLDPLNPMSAPLTAPVDPIQQRKQEQEMRKMNRMKLQGTQKVQKIEADKHKAEEKTWKLKKRSFDKSVRDLKRTGV